MGSAVAGGPVICCGTPIDPDDMEEAGTGIDHTPEGDRTVPVYRPRAGGTTDVYTFSGAQTPAVPDNGGEYKNTTPATWLRWTAN